MASNYEQLLAKLGQQLEFIYKDINITQPTDELAKQLTDLMRLSSDCPAVTPFTNRWTEEDVILITYGDSILKKDEAPLQTLRRFINKNMSDTINSVHILPFFPYSSDDGFSIIDYSTVNESLGNWNDIQDIAKERNLMSDLVINHCSSRGLWFQNFIKGEGEGHDYFFTAPADTDTKGIVRPRTSSLFRTQHTASGEQSVWCTFSHDQVDFDFRNPEVLKAFVVIIRQYLDMGVKIFRFDAIAFLWKIIGTPCINLPETHEVVRLLRTLIEHANQDAIIITETNIPNTQNLTYFGNANEAHAIYNFSLPPLLLNTLLTGSCLYLKRWLLTMPPAQSGTTYFNFIASHDGIGLRPVEGLLEDEETQLLAKTVEGFGGKISWRTTEDGDQKPYEMNISLFDAMQGTTDGKDQWNFERFICAHSVMFALEGIPGIYVHSMLGTQNDYKKVEDTSSNRSINRHRWQEDLLNEALEDDAKHHNKVLTTLNDLLAVRIKQPAFHPNAAQFVLHLGLQLFGFWRQSHDEKQSIFCISNITNAPLALPLSELNLMTDDKWFELISHTEIDDIMAEIELAPYQSVWITNQVAE